MPIELRGLFDMTDTARRQFALGVERGVTRLTVTPQRD
jgi:hypothetical protein